MPKPPSKSQKEGQGKRPAPKLTRGPSNFTFKDIEDNGKRRRTRKRIRAKSLRAEIKKNITDNMPTAAQGVKNKPRTRKPPQRLTY